MSAGQFLKPRGGIIAHWMNRLVRLLSQRKPPTRITACPECEEKMVTEIMEGTVIHFGCLWKRHERAAAEKEKEAKRREQIELMKVAVREVLTEREPNTTCSQPGKPATE